MFRNFISKRKWWMTTAIPKNTQQSTISDFKGKISLTIEPKTSTNTKIGLCIVTEWTNHSNRGTKITKTVKCLPRSSKIFEMLQKLFTATLTDRTTALVDTNYVNKNICFTHVFEFDLISHWFFSFLVRSSVSCQFRFNKFNKWRLHCWIHAGWTHVGCATLLLFVRYIRHIFYISTMVYVHYGKIHYVFFCLLTSVDIG